ncbi:MAG: hypothetical protein ACKVOW_18235 [Chitinophagaceae bacterium]
MKKSMQIFVAGLIISYLFALLTNEKGTVHDFFSFAGLGNLLLSVLLIIPCIITFIAGKKEIGKALLNAIALLLLTGTITCSVFPMGLNVH